MCPNGKRPRDLMPSVVAPVSKGKVEKATVMVRGRTRGRGGIDGVRTPVAL